MTSELKRILYVEDEEDIRTVAQMALEIGGFTLEICSSGKEAIEKARGFSPDLILLDVMMPEMDGPETLKELQQIPEISGVPTIFMTAKAQSHEIAQFKKLGAIEVIVKPFDPMTLASDIRQIWEKHHE